MKIGKILLGVLLLFGIGKEYVQASRDLGSFLSPGIIIAVILFLMLCTWLIGSGFSKKKLKIKSFDFLKFFIITCVSFLCISFFNLFSTVVPSGFVEINGLKIPLNKCIDGSRRIISDKKGRKEYCLCLSEKITSDTSLKQKHKDALERGALAEVLTAIQNTKAFTELDLDNCLKNVEFRWTDNVVKTLKENGIKELKDTEFEETNDIEAYCDCLIKEYKNFPLNKILEDGFNESAIGISIDSLCTEQSKR
ncbi:MAG: hypothetical protein ACPGTO_06770 [Polaribacter sp.]